MSLKAVVKTITTYNKFLITSHINPEADAIGSELALFELIRKLGKQAVCINSDRMAGHYRFLPGIKNIKHDLKGKRGRFDAILVLDSPTISRIGGVQKILKKVKVIVNIDHHISNSNFGNINWVKPKASSTAEMVYTLYKKTGVAISKEIALYIYVGILTDTGSFNYSNTTNVTHQITSDLLSYGLQPEEIFQWIYENKSLKEVKLLGQVISTLEVEKNGLIACMFSTRQMLVKTDCLPCNTENFINFARSIRGIKIAIFIREDFKKPNYFNVSLRSNGDIDVNKIALSFGGGGHKNAAGCVIRGTLAEVKKKILTEARKML